MELGSASSAQLETLSKPQASQVIELTQRLPISYNASHIVLL